MWHTATLFSVFAVAVSIYFLSLVSYLEYSKPRVFSAQFYYGNVFRFWFLWTRVDDLVHQKLCTVYVLLDDKFLPGDFGALNSKSPIILLLLLLYYYYTYTNKQSAPHARTHFSSHRKLIPSIQISRNKEQTLTHKTNVWDNKTVAAAICISDNLIFALDKRQIKNNICNLFGLFLTENECWFIWFRSWRWLLFRVDYFSVTCWFEIANRLATVNVHQADLHNFSEFHIPIDFYRPRFVRSNWTDSSDYDSDSNENQREHEVGRWCLWFMLQLSV